MASAWEVGRVKIDNNDDNVSCVVVLFYCFQYCGTDRFYNELLNCVFDGLEASCNSTAADIYTTMMKRMFTDIPVNCTISNNSVTCCLLVCSKVLYAAAEPDWSAKALCSWVVRWLVGSAACSSVTRLMNTIF